MKYTLLLLGLVQSISLNKFSVTDTDTRNDKNYETGSFDYIHDKATGTESKQMQEYFKKA